MNGIPPPDTPRPAAKEIELGDVCFIFGLGVLMGLSIAIGVMLPLWPVTPRVSSEKPYFAETDHLTICSFNIQSLGFLKARDHKALAACLRDFDVVLIQELIAPPYAGTFPNGDRFKPSETAAQFFNAMSELGFAYRLSEEDTGRSDKMHTKALGTEWWAAFYRPRRVVPATDLAKGFLAEQRSDHRIFARVPYAFPFRTSDDKCDFVLISVHLKPGAENGGERREELAAIAEWVHAHDQVEKDFLFVGDMNLENKQELRASLPADFSALNEECRPTNTHIEKPKPYDHVFYRPEFTTELDKQFGFVVVNLIEHMRPRWRGKGEFPGDPYDHNTFRQVYSDHHPVVFRLAIPA